MAFLVPLAALAIQSAAGVAVSAAAWVGAALSSVVGFIQTTKKPKAADRVAQAITIQMGERPRSAVLGKAWAAGTFVFGFNSGDKNIFEWILIKLADHPINDYEGFLIGDEYYGFAGDGAQPSFTVGGTPHLEMWFLDGTQTTVPSEVLSAAGAKWNADWIMAGCSGIWIKYRANPKVWPGGRPSFRHYLGGARVYDPRHDSTVEGGSGAQRVNDYSTYVYSENLVVLALNYRLGIYNGTSRTHLMVGRGLSLEQALGTSGQTLAEYIAAANAADEEVDLKAGGTQLRYQGGLVIASDEEYVDVLDKFAKGCAGIVVPRAGRLTIQPGVSVTPHEGFTDDDIVSGEEIIFSPFLSDTERVNTVVATYAGLEQRGQDASVVRRQFSDLEEDSPDDVPRPYEVALPLDAIVDNIRAQRIAEIWRRLGRYERRVTLTLPPRFANVEVGDWIPWTSDYLLGGDTTMFRVEKAEKRVNWAQRLTLREIDDAAFDWDAETDELEPGQQVPEPQEIDDLEVEDFVVSAVTVGGVPGILAEWTAPGAVAASTLIIQVREEGTTDATTIYVDSTAISLGKVAFTNGVGGGLDMEVRARYDSVDRNRVTPWTSWLDVSTDELISGDTTKPIGDVNRVRYSRMERDTYGWGMLYNPNSLSYTEAAGEFEGYRFYKIEFTATAGSQVISIGTVFVENPITLNGGERISVQARTEASGPCDHSVFQIWFYDKDGVQLTGGDANEVIATDLDDQIFPGLMAGFCDVPANARSAHIELYYFTDGAGSGVLTITMPMVCGASPAQTVHPQFTAGLGIAPDTATRVGDLEVTVAAISATGVKAIGSMTPGSSKTLGGASWVTLVSADLTGIGAGTAEVSSLQLRPSAGSFGGMSGGTTMTADLRMSHRPTSGGTSEVLWSSTASLAEPTGGSDPVEIEIVQAASPPVALVYTGDVTFEWQMKRSGGATSQSNLIGVMAGTYRPSGS